VRREGIKRSQRWGGGGGKGGERVGDREEGDGGEEVRRGEGEKAGRGWGIGKKEMVGKR
jgi:hypothetical protein